MLNRVVVSAVLSLSLSSISAFTAYADEPVDEAELVCEGEDLITTENPTCKLEMIIAGEKTVCFTGNSELAAALGQIALKTRKDLDSVWEVTEEGILATTELGDSILVERCAD